MKIGMIGTGALGSTIARKLVASGHELKVTNATSPEELSKTAVQLGATPASLKDVVKNVDIVFLSVPTNAIPSLPSDLFAGISKDVIVIDTTNYYPYRDGDMEGGFVGNLESVWVSDHLGRPVIKAFNNLLSYTLEHKGKEAGNPERIAMAISGDDKKSKKIVSQLINDIGFDAIDVGDLSESWRHQPGMPSYCTELTAGELKHALTDSEGIKNKSGQMRDRTTDNLMARTAAPSHEEILEVIRSLFPTNPKQGHGERDKTKGVLKSKAHSL